MVNTKALALAGGIFWGVWVFLLTLINLYSGYGSMWAALMSDIYPGYDITLVGSFVGLVYGFIDGFISLGILGWLYNRFIPAV